MNPSRWVIATLLLALAPAPLHAQAATEYEGAAALALAARRLGATERVLMIAAHPDDENTALLASLALGRGADVAYLSLTRGEGGQNGIGPELDDALGLLRTEELLAARRLDAAQQFFTRAYDYGYSRSAEEAFQHWPHDSLLADVVAVVRAFRPDVIVPIFSGTPRDGHGQHQASGMLAREAFVAAADPARFPEQIARGLLPHRAREVYQASWRGTDEPGPRIATGELDPVIGRSHFQIAMASRSRHRSQDMGRPETPGPQWSALVRQTPGAPVAAAGASLFAGIDTTLEQRAAAAPPLAGAQARELAGALRMYADAVARVRADLNPLEPAAIAPHAARAARALVRANALLAGSDPHAALRYHVERELRDAQALLARASGLVIDAVADDDRIVPGQSFGLAVTLWNGGRDTVRVSALTPALPAGWRAEPLDSLPSQIAPASLVARRFTVHVPRDAAPTEPYFLRNARDGDMYDWPADVMVGVPFEPAPVQATASLHVAGAELPLEVAATYREVDRRAGESRRPLLVMPVVSVDVAPRVAALPTAAMTRSVSDAAGTLSLRVRLRSQAPDAYAGTLEIQAPAGWRAEPSSLPLRFAAPGAEHSVTVRVTPPATLAAGEYPIDVRFRGDDGRVHARGVQLVEYPHTDPRPLYHAARTRVRVLDARLASDLRVGYVPGAGDDVTEALAQLGARVDFIDEATLARGDLDAYDVIVTGIRAYEVNPALIAHNDRLLAYVERGGNVVVQYSKYELVEGSFPPYPLTIARPHDRVTDETAAVRLLDPVHPLLAQPNRITEADFAGWAQELGLYYPRTWDERYTPLLEMSDPGMDPARGALLVAQHGKGTWIYTGLALFRQIPEGVPGAYRILANLVSYGVQRRDCERRGTCS